MQTNRKDSDSEVETETKTKPAKIVTEILTIAYKDLKEFQRNRIGLFFSLAFPIMLIAAFGYMFPGSLNAVHDVPIGIVNLDKGPIGNQTSNAILKALSNSTSFKLVEVSTEAEARTMMFAGTIKGAVIIPENLTETLNAATKSSILLLNNPENTALSATITQSFDKLVNSISQQLATKMISKDAPSLNPEFLIQPLEIQTQNIVSGGQSPFDFVAPGFIGLGVMMSGLTGVGAALSREREIGTMDGLLMAPIYRVSIILGKILAQSVRNLFQGALIIVLAVFLFGINIRGDPLLIATIVMLGMLSFLGFGILVTSIAKEQESAQIILSFIQFPMLFLSGVLFPLEQMPIQLQYVARILPLTYAVDALRKVMVLGAGFNAVAFQLLFLTTLSIVTIAIGVPVFERAVRR